MRVCIEPSSYLPSRAFFDMLAQCDVWVPYDSIQFSKGSRTNRTQIKTPNGLEWLTIPLQQSPGLRSIDNLTVNQADWAKTHLARIYQHYLHAPYFCVYYHVIKDLYASIAHETSISIINQHFIKGICECLGLSCAVQPLNEKDLTDILRASGATQWVLAHDEIERIGAQDIARQSGVTLRPMVMENPAPYAQLHPPFRQPTSIIDWLMCEGPVAVETWRKECVTPHSLRGLVK